MCSNVVAKSVLWRQPRNATAVTKSEKQGNQQRIKRRRETTNARNENKTNEMKLSNAAVALALAAATGGASAQNDPNLNSILANWG